jgi:hypothetical protein
MSEKERYRVLHVITRLDRGGSAENTLLTVRGTERSRFATTLAFGAAAVRRARVYRVESMVEKIEVLYDTLLEEKKIAVAQKLS